MQFEINEQLREELIAKSIEDEIEDNTKNGLISAKIVFGVLIIGFGVLFSFMALPYFLRGRYHEGVEEWGIAMMVLLPIIVICIIIFAIVWKINKKEIQSDLPEKLRNMSCSIEDGTLVVKGEKSKRTYKLNQIRHLSKYDDLMTFDYRGDETEMYDWYEPSLYETLKQYLK